MRRDLIIPSNHDGMSFLEWLLFAITVMLLALALFMNLQKVVPDSLMRGAVKDEIVMLQKIMDQRFQIMRSNGYHKMGTISHGLDVDFSK